MKKRVQVGETTRVRNGKTEKVASHVREMNVPDSAVASDSAAAVADASAVADPFDKYNVLNRPHVRNLLEDPDRARQVLEGFAEANRDHYCESGPGMCPVATARDALDLHVYDGSERHDRQEPDRDWRHHAKQQLLRVQQEA